MPNYVFDIIRLKMSQITNALSGGLVCHHGISDDVYPIGGSVEPDETFMGSAIRHCRNLVDYCVKLNDDRLYLTKNAQWLYHSRASQNFYLCHRRSQQGP